MQIKLLSDRVLIDAGDTEVKTSSGLIVTKSKDASDFQNGTVTAVGPGKWEPGNGFISVQVEVGQKVIFQYGKEIMIEGKPYQLVNQSDIIMVL